MYRGALDDAAVLFAREQLGESEEVAEDSVLKIQQFLEENPNINARSDRKSILCFLRTCKFNIEQAEKKIKRYKSRRVNNLWNLSNNFELITTQCGHDQ